MGIMSASASFTRFLVPEPVKKGFWDLVDQGLKAGHFGPAAEGRSESAGFTSWDDLFDTSFDLSSYRKAEYVAFRFRVDRKKVPPILLKQGLRTAIRKYREEHEGKWPTRQEKSRIRDDVLDELLAKALPQPAACEVAWNTRRNWLLAGTSGRRMLEALFGHLEQYLRLHPVPLKHVEWAQALLPAGSPERAVLQTLISGRPDNAAAEGRALGHEFLTWLWFFMETEGGRLTLADGRDAESHPGERVVLSHPQDGRERVVCSTPAVSLHEARTALKHGKRVEAIQIFTKIGENEYFLSLDTDLCTLRGLRTPKQGKEPGDEEQDGLFLEKMYFLEETFACLDAAYGLFLSQRLGNRWESAIHPRLKKWFEQGV